MSPPTLLHGCGNHGVAFPTAEDTTALLDLLDHLKIKRLDISRRYPSVSPGLSEPLLGQAEAAEPGYTIDTKFDVSFATGVAGSLSADKIQDTIEESLASLRVHSVNVLYAHVPDPKTPVEESARALNDAF